MRVDGRRMGERWTGLGGMPRLRVSRKGRRGTPTRSCNKPPAVTLRTFVGASPRTHIAITNARAHSRAHTAVRPLNTRHVCSKQLVLRDGGADREPLMTPDDDEPPWWCVGSRSDRSFMASALLLAETGGGGGDVGGAVVVLPLQSLLLCVVVTLVAFEIQGVTWDFVSREQGGQEVVKGSRVLGGP